jgi:hypothetical protein
MIEFDIGLQFSHDPAGRFYNETTLRKKNNLNSGEAFREEKLHPLLLNLAEGEKINFIMDNDVESYGSSFLVEGFAGIVKYGYMKADTLISKIEFEYKDPDFEFFEKKIIQYINDAKFNSEPYKSTKV